MVREFSDKIRERESQLSILSSHLTIDKDEDDRYGDGEREEGCFAGLSERKKQMEVLFVWRKKMTWFTRWLMWWDRQDSFQYKIHRKSSIARKKYVKICAQS